MTKLKKKSKTTKENTKVRAIKVSSKKIKSEAKTSRVKQGSTPVVSELPKQLAEAALTVLDSRKAEEIISIHLGPKSSMADYMILASAQSSRQLVAIAHYLEEAFNRLGIKRVRIEGQQQANWVLVDAGDVIVHLFRPEVRAYYDLEQKWGKPEKRRLKTKTRSG